MEDSDEDSSWSSTSTSSVENPIFKPAALPLILELHDIRKDDPSMPKLKHSDSIPPLGATGIKIKKHKKSKKKIVPSNTSASTASLSDTSSIAPSATDVKEEFYDAHESYHAIPENQIPVNLAMENITQSDDTNQDPAKAPELAVKSPELAAKAPESAANAPDLAAKASELAAAASQPQKTKTTAAKAKETFPVIKPTEPP